MSDENETTEAPEPVVDDTPPDAWGEDQNAGLTVEHNELLAQELAGDDGYEMPHPLPSAAPEEYVLTTDGVVWLHQVDGNLAVDLVAVRPFVVRQRLRDDHDESRYTLAWLSDDDEVRTVTVPAGVLADARKLVAAFPEVVVTSRQATQALHYATGCLRQNRRWLVQHGEEVSTGLGWPLTGTAYFVSGPGRPRVVEDVKNTGLWLDGHRTEGSLERWQEAVQAVADRPLVQLMITAALAAPALRLLNRPSFAVDLSGSTSGGKTISLRAAASVWGDPNATLVTWKDTKASVEHHLSVMRGMPFLADETQLARPEDLEDVVYGLTEGRSKGRSRQDGGGLQATQRLEAILLTTGEQPLTSMTRKNGITPRVVTLTGQPCADKRQADELKAAVAADFGHAGPLFVEWLRHQAVDELQVRHHRWIKRLEVEGEAAVIGRRAESVAVLALVNEMAAGIGLVPLLGEDVWEWLVAGGDAAISAGGDRAREALDDVLAWAVSRKRQFHSLTATNGMETRFEPTQGWLGRWDEGGDFIAFRPGPLEEHLTRRNFQAQAVLATWRERNWLQHTKGSLQGVKKVDGKSVRCIVLTQLEGLNEAETGAEYNWGVQG